MLLPLCTICCIFAHLANTSYSLFFCSICQCNSSASLPLLLSPDRCIVMYWSQALLVQKFRYMSFQQCLCQHRSSAVCTVRNDCHHLLVPATVYLSQRGSFRTLPKYDSQHHMQDRNAAMAAHDRDSKPFPVKEPKKDDNKTSYKKDINVRDKTQPSLHSDTSQVSPESQPSDVVTEEKKGIFARFKMAYKQYGKVLIGVHLATSTVWFSSFYYAAVM